MLDVLDVGSNEATNVTPTSTNDPWIENGAFAGRSDIPDWMKGWLHRVADGWEQFWSPLTRSSSGSSEIASTTPTDIPASTIDSDGNIIDTSIANITQGTPSLASYMKDNPNLDPVDYLKYMANNSDEWAEKYIDYALEKASIDEQNKYTANREDTAYQRLVKDLKAAGLNPAMMFGSSASTSASGSVGVVKASEGANSRVTSNYNKIKSLVLAMMLYQLKSVKTITDVSFGSMTDFLKLLG